MTEIWEPHAPTAGGGLRPLSAEGLDLRVSGPATARTVGEGVVEVTAEGKGDVRIEWRVPCVDATAFWTPEPRGTGWLPAAWSAPRRTSLANGAPIAALIGTGDVAICAFAAERADVLAGAGVLEETGEFRFWAQATDRLTVRIDTSRRHFARCLAASPTGGGPAARPTSPPPPAAPPTPPGTRCTRTSRPRASRPRPRSAGNSAWTSSSSTTAG